MITPLITQTIGRRRRKRNIPTRIAVKQHIQYVNAIVIRIVRIFPRRDRGLLVKETVIGLKWRIKHPDTTAHGIPTFPVLYLPRVIVTW